MFYSYVEQPARVHVMLASMCVSICIDIYCNAVNDTGAKKYTSEVQAKK